MLGKGAGMAREGRGANEHLFWRTSPQRAGPAKRAIVHNAHAKAFLCAGCGNEIAGTPRSDNDYIKILHNSTVHTFGNKNIKRYMHRAVCGIGSRYE